MTADQPRPTLVEFLLARLGEDEATVPDVECRCEDGEPQRPDCGDRILAEVEAKRRIVYHEFSNWGESTTLRLLTLPYSDHPDYDEGWRP